MRAYHGVLERLKIKPQRSLANDLELQSGVMSYGGSSTVSVPAGMPRSEIAKPAGVAKRATAAAAHDCGCSSSAHECQCHAKPAASQPDALPDFGNMTTAEKLAYNKAKRDRIFG